MNGYVLSNSTCFLQTEKTCDQNCGLFVMLLQVMALSVLHLSCMFYINLKLSIDSSQLLSYFLSGRDQPFLTYHKSAADKLKTHPSKRIEKSLQTNNYWFQLKTWQREKLLIIINVLPLSKCFQTFTSGEASKCIDLYVWKG